MPTGTPFNFTKEFIEEQYIKQRKSCTSIAKEINCDKKAISDAVKKYGFELRKGTGNHTIAISGRKYFNLFVVSKAYKDDLDRVFWNCKCDCDGPNSKMVVLGASLKSGHTKSCGCRTRTALYKR